MLAQGSKLSYSYISLSYAVYAKTNNGNNDDDNVFNLYKKKRCIHSFSSRKRDWGDGKLSTFSAFHYHHCTAQFFFKQSFAIL